MVALKRAFGVGLLGAGGQPGGIGAGAPNLIYFDDISANLSSALIFSLRSGSMSRLNATLGRELEPLGQPRLLGGSAGPRSPDGILDWPWSRTPCGSGARDGPRAAAWSPTDDKDKDGEGRMARAARSAWSVVADLAGVETDLDFRLDVFNFVQCLDAKLHRLNAGDLNLDFQKWCVEGRAWTSRFAVPRESGWADVGRW